MSSNDTVIKDDIIEDIEDLTLTKDNITFESEISIIEECNQIYAYIPETDILDKITGIYTDTSHNDIFNVNYYGVYNIKDNTFGIIANVTIYEDFKDLDKVYPNICNNLKNIYYSTSDYYIPLSEEERNEIFNKFKDYCIKDCKDDYNVSSFNELIETIKEELDIEEEII